MEKGIGYGMENLLAPLVISVIGLLLTAIGVLVCARLGFILDQIKEINQRHETEVADRAERWKKQFEKCSLELATLSRLIGVLEGKGVLPTGWGAKYNSVSG